MSAERCAGVLCCPDCENPLAVVCPNGHADAAERAFVREFGQPAERGVQPTCEAGCGTRRPGVRGRIPKRWVCPSCAARGAR